MLVGTLAPNSVGMMGRFIELLWKCQNGRTTLTVNIIRPIKQKKISLARRLTTAGKPSRLFRDVQTQKSQNKHLDKLCGVWGLLIPSKWVCVPSSSAWQWTWSWTRFQRWFGPWQSDGSGWAITLDWRLVYLQDLVRHTHSSCDFLLKIIAPLLPTGKESLRPLLFENEWKQWIRE